MKATAIAPANIAFIKYWGKKDAALRLPLNSSISMNLSQAKTTSTVEFSSKYKKDEVYFAGKIMEREESQRVVSFLDRIRNLANSTKFAKVYTQNSFPKGTGIASSASGFAALTLAGTVSLGLKLSEKDLSILARLGSGSAARSIPDGFVEWVEGNDSDSSYAYSLYPENYWDLRDIILIVTSEKKKIKSTKGHENALSSIFFKSRLANLPKKINTLKKALKDRNFQKFGELVENEAVELHTIMMTQRPPLFYWNGVTMKIIQSIISWRNEGLAVFFTIDAGPNVHLICQGKNEKEILAKIKAIDGVESLLINKPAKGARLTKRHLF